MSPYAIRELISILEKQFNASENETKTAPEREVAKPIESRAPMRELQIKVRVDSSELDQLIEKAERAVAILGKIPFANGTFIGVGIGEEHDT